MKLSKIVKTFLPVFWMGLIFFLSNKPYDYYPLEATNTQQILAHIFLYAVLSFLTIFAIMSWDKNWQIKNIILFSIFFSILYGISDEYHQGFVPGRFVSYGDLIFDALGAIMGVLVFYYYLKITKPKLLLHICCIGCGAYIIQELKKNFRITLYFFNPNIFPGEEYKKRLNESKKIADKLKTKLIIGDYDHKNWLKLIQGCENEPERGRRCLICYKTRLEAAAKLAQKLNFDFFSTTLTISPHKDAEAISRISNEISKEYKIKYLDKDFKKHDGFKKSCAYSKELGLYRQEYCGCEFSIGPKRKDYKI